VNDKQVAPVLFSTGAFLLPKILSVIVIMTGIYIDIKDSNGV